MYVYMYTYIHTLHPAFLAAEGAGRAAGASGRGGGAQSSAEGAGWAPLTKLLLADVPFSVR